MLKNLKTTKFMSNGKNVNYKAVKHHYNLVGSINFFFLLLISLLVTFSTVNAQIFVEENGLVVAEVESANPIGKWQKATTISGFSGTAYLIGTADNFGLGGKEILSYKFSITTPGIYQIQVRSKIGQGTSTTDFNDSWIRLIGGDTKPITPVANDNMVSNYWYKYYQNKSSWTWQTSNKDNDPHSISWNLTQGNYWFQISMRSKGHAIDKIVLWNRSKYALANTVTGITSTADNTALDALAISKVDSDANPLPGVVVIIPTNPVSRFFDRTKDILIAQFDSKPDADDIHAQAALASILVHPDGAGINYFAVAGAYGTQTGKYIDSNSLFAMAFGEQNTKWTDANTDRANSVTRIVAKVKPILEAGGWVWVQEAGQSDITADWIAALLSAGVPAATIKTNVKVVQHSVWNEQATTTAKLTYVKNNANYIDIDDGNVELGDYSSSPARLAQTPKYVSTDKSLIVNAMSAINPNVKAREFWVETDRIIKASGFNASYSEITKGGVDFSDCVENWFILGLGVNSNSAAKFWSRYVVNNPGISSNQGINGGKKAFSIKKVSSVDLEIQNPFKEPFDIKVVNLRGQVIMQKTGINQSLYTFSSGLQTNDVVLVFVSNKVASEVRKIRF